MTNLQTLPENPNSILPTEEWRPVKGYEGFYMVTNTGKVKSLDRRVAHATADGALIKGREMKLQLLFGYSMVMLQKYGKKKSVRVHRLVADAFIPNPENKPHINHINAVRNDNRVENLEWCTPMENMHHCIKMGRQVKRKFNSDEEILRDGRHPNSKIVHQYSLSGELIKVWPCVNTAARALKISRKTIGRSARGEYTKNHDKQFIWRYPAS